MKDIQELNENKYTTSPKLWDTMKAYSIKCLYKILERSHTSDLNTTPENSRTKGRKHNQEEYTTGSTSNP